ncbi:MAG: hypothetical protein J6D27_00035 [Ruminiclostridium sp.]|nr:hypothetical protein [Ruminococcus sp.]MBP3921343.1 hypothetical protein [Ruminiclostridium sp.]
MNILKMAAFLAAAACLMNTAGCGNDEESGSTKTISGIGELVTPAEDSEDYSLGAYYEDETGVKLYFGDETISPDVVQALKNYFLAFQNEDYDAYKANLASDYVERYDTYLQENYGYDLRHSFELQCQNLRDSMLAEIYGGYDAENTENYTGDFTITRLRVEAPVLGEGETEESLTKQFFSYLDTSFDMDYYSFVSEQADSLEYVTFFIMAKGEDGEEHLVVSEMDIVFAVKDGKYYAFG